MRKEAINHDGRAFTENKRYRTKPRSAPAWWIETPIPFTKPI